MQKIEHVAERFSLRKPGKHYRMHKFKLKLRNHRKTLKTYTKKLLTLDTHQKHWILSAVKVVLANFQISAKNC